MGCEFSNEYSRHPIQIYSKYVQIKNRVKGQLRGMGIPLQLALFFVIVRSNLIGNT
jgi:hypothetical protein